MLGLDWYVLLCNKCIYLKLKWFWHNSDDPAIHINFHQHLNINGNTNLPSDHDKCRNFKPPWLDRVAYLSTRRGNKTNLEPHIEFDIPLKLGFDKCWWSTHFLNNRRNAINVVCAIYSSDVVKHRQCISNCFWYDVCLRIFALSFHTELCGSDMFTIRCHVFVNLIPHSNCQWIGRGRLSCR